MTIPIGVITFFIGNHADIPSGWQACDGTNGTPDLTGDRYFLLGASSDSDVTDTGGNNDHTHNCPDLASKSWSHSHSVTANTGGNSGTVGVYHSTGGGYISAANGHSHSATVVANSGGVTHSHTVGTSGTADSQPPFKKYYLIMKIS